MTKKNFSVSFFLNIGLFIYQLVFGSKPCTKLEKKTTPLYLAKYVHTINGQFREVLLYIHIFWG
jgi:hypothetical protein